MSRRPDKELPSDAPRQNRVVAKARKGRNFAYSLFVTGSLFSRLLEEELASSRVTASDLGLLSAVAGEHGVTPTELGETLGIRPSTLTARIHGLVARRYIRRVANRDDGRSYRLALTASGRRAWEASAPALHSALVQVERELRIDVDDLEDALAELERALQAALAHRQESARKPRSRGAATPRADERSRRPRR